MKPKTINHYLGKENFLLYREILSNLRAGRYYGYDITSVKYPYFQEVLYITPGGYIGYTNYGSSAVKNTLADLVWLIETIFKTDARGFLEKYSLNP